MALCPPTTAASSHKAEEGNAKDMYIHLGAYLDFVSGIVLQEHLGWGSNSFGESMAVAGWTCCRMSGDAETFSPNQGTAAH